MAKNKNYNLDLVPDDFKEATEANVLAQDFTDPVPEKPEVKYVKVVKCDKLRIRQQPSTSAATLTTVNKGEKLILKNKVDATWSHVQTLAGIDGYAMNDFLKK